MKRRLLTAEEKEARRKTVIEMYVNGYTLEKISSHCHIPMGNIRGIVKEAGVYIPNRAAIMNRKHPEGYKKHIQLHGYEESLETQREKENMRDAFRVQYVGTLREYIKVGDIIKIKTVKGTSEEDEDGEERVKSGMIRKARVVDTSNNRFCVVELLTNEVRESIQWSAIWLAIKEKKNYIE